MPDYRRPPITEAALELRLGSPVSFELVEKANQRLKKDFAKSDALNSFSLNFDLATRTTQVDAVQEGFRLVSEDGTEIVTAKTSGFTISQLAPYRGWDNFKASAQARWLTWKKAVGERAIGRLGLRYINRIDVPADEEALVAIQDYLQIMIHFPGDARIGDYTLQAQLECGAPFCTLTVKSGTAPDVIVDHQSFLLDLDIGREAPPQSEEEIWTFFDVMRDEKNRVFESYVTDKSRELFNRA